MTLVVSGSRRFKTRRFRDHKKEWNARFSKNEALRARAHWLRQYKGTKAQYVAYLRTSHCEICGDRFTDEGISTRCQDHCHNTGQIRSVLCSQCNLAQGLLRSVENAMKMVEYFVKWEIMPVAPIITKTNEKPDAYEGFTLFDVSNSPLEPPLTPIAPVVTVGGTTTKRTRSVCVLPHSITPSGASIEDVEVLPDV